jgi:DNA polymerase I-like protein with 3'-5' exonuclease and polymerase domains
VTYAPKTICIDFETEGIEARPKYPPKPVSLGIKWPDESKYRIMAWGHPSGNTVTEKEARGELKRAYDSKYPILAQNFMFDGDVAEIHWDLKLPTWDRYHDSMFALFLWDPHASTLALKPSAERLLGIAPEEQDLMYEWIVANVPQAHQKPSTAGAYICECPFKIVAPYLKGDLTRTLKLFEFLYPRIVDAGMLAAYQRELKLMPILLRNARRGMRLDMARLEQDIPGMREGVQKADTWLCKRLGISNVDSDRQLGEALYDKGIITEITRTKKGQISTSKKVLTLDRFTDKKVYHVLQYRGQMSTSLGTFAEPWHELASASTDGSLYPNWSQVRAPRNGGAEKDMGGARSGRIICSKPNFLNIPKRWKRAITAGYVHPAWLRVPELPFMRSYVLPHKGKQWGRRDMNQQEVRIFAHYEEGPVMAGFLADPRYDVHEGVRAEEEAALIASGLRDSFDRDSAKTTVFGAFYGQGLTGLMEALRLRDPEDKDVGRAIHRALHRAVPSIAGLSDQLKALAADGRPIKTWGGRVYYEEPPKYSEKYGRDMTFAYKLISYLIQGGGADIVKEVIVRYDAHPQRTEDMLVTVYDELDVDLPMSVKGVRHEMKVLGDVIESIELDVPMLSDGEVGDSWGSLKPWRD